MQGNQMHIGQSLRTAQQFLDAHADVLGTLHTSDARRRLDAAIATLEASTVEQGTSQRATRGEVRRRSQLEQALIRKFMTPLSKFARAQLDGAANYAALTPSANQLRRERLVQSARSMADAAAPHAEALTAAKFPQDFLQQLRAAAEAVRASIDTKADTRVRQTGATQQVAAALRTGRNAVATLDSLVTHLILGDRRLEQEWRSAKRVPRMANRSGGPQATVSSAAPATQEVPLKSAA